jgi:hypothetical protein
MKWEYFCEPFYSVIVYITFCWIDVNVRAGTFIPKQNLKASDYGV